MSSKDMISVELKLPPKVHFCLEKIGILKGKDVSTFIRDVIIFDYLSTLDSDPFLEFIDAHFLEVKKEYEQLGIIYGQSETVLPEHDSKNEEEE